MLICLVLQSVTAFSQPVAWSSDSSQLIFPNNVTVDFTQRKTGNAIRYQITDVGFRTLIAQTNFLHSSLELQQKRVLALVREVEVRDSVINVLKTRTEATNERLQLYSSGYEELKMASAKYDHLMKSTVADLESCRKGGRNAKRKGFIRGVGAGVAGGLLMAAMIFLTVR